MRTLILLATLTVLATSAATADTLYVQRSAVPGGNGQSWQTAHWSIHDALAVAIAGDEVWIARGNYKPSEGTGIATGVSTPYSVPSGVQVYGGFSGTESLRELRDWFRLRTVLDGGSEHALMTVANGDSNTMVDGLYFERGKAANGGAMTIDGGTPFIRNCIFNDNVASGRGGAIHAKNVYRVHFEYCTFARNRANRGGAIAIDGASPNNKTVSRPFVAQCAFEGNEAVRGGAIDIANSRTLTVTSSVFTVNVVQENGGCIYADKESWPYIITSTFYNNRCLATDGAACIAAHGGDMKNSILWHNDSLLHLQVVQLDTANIDTMFTTNSNCVKDDFDHGFYNFDPSFIDADHPRGADGFYGTDDDGLYFPSNGTLVDRGFIDRYVNSRRTDMVGNPRVVLRSPDLGAYETQREGHNQYRDIVEEMKRGGINYLSRHCATDWGLQDPGPTPECKNERNLIWEGRGQGRMMGKVMKALGIVISDPTCSPTCRTWESAYLTYGTYRKDDMWRVGGTGSDSPRLKDLAKIPAPGTMRGIYSHDAVILTTVPLGTAEINEGDGIVIRPDGIDYEMISHFCSDTWERYRVRFPDGTVDVAEETPAQSQHVSVYPNPAADGVTVRGVVFDDATRIDVVDITGRIVASQRANPWVDLHALSPGIYVVKVAGLHPIATATLTITR